MFLTFGTIDAVPSRLAVFARCAVEAFIATTLPIAVHAILTLAVVGAPAAEVSRAFEAAVAIKTRATGMSLKHRAAVSLFSSFISKKNATGGNFFRKAFKDFITIKVKALVLIQ